jgi:hypothetical protein
MFMHDQRRYREDCKDDQPAEPWYRRRWLIHALTIWGFLGLLAGDEPAGGQNSAGPGPRMVRGPGPGGAASEVVSRRWSPCPCR